MLYIATAISVFGSYEAYLTGWFGWFSEEAPQSIRLSISNPAYFQPHDLLGCAPLKDVQIKATKYYNSRLLYDVQYTINSNGIRIGSDHCSDSSSSVLFFGGSFTFGAGVKDNETLPYKFEEKFNCMYRVFNFGFHGYGPHQMLSILENEMEREIIGDTYPQYAIYQAIPSHVYRCTGHTFWDKAGPQYILNENGDAVYDGHFHNWFFSNFIRVINKSHLVRRLFLTTGKASHEDIELFIGIIKKSAKIFHERYSGRFYVLLLPGENPLYEDILLKLEENQFKVIKVEDILPDEEFKNAKYRIPYDNHPNSLAYEKIAKYLSEFLREKK